MVYLPAVIPALNCKCGDAVFFNGHIQVSKTQYLDVFWYRTTFEDVIQSRRCGTWCNDPRRNLWDHGALPDWFGATLPRTDMRNDTWYTERAFGWPLRAFVHSEWEYDAYDSVSDEIIHHRESVTPGLLIGAMRSRGPIALESVSCGVVPILPIWSGLALNMLLSIMFVVGAYFTMSLVVIRYRRGVGSCISCGYRLVEMPTYPTTCSECGARQRRE